MSDTIISTNRKSTTTRTRVASVTATAAPSFPGPKSTAPNGRRKMVVQSSSMKSSRSSRSATSAGRGSTTPRSATSGNGTVARSGKVASPSTPVTTKKSGTSSNIDDSTNRSECSAEEQIDRECLNDGVCFSIDMRTTGKQLQRVIGCSCPPEWKGEYCEIRHYGPSRDRAENHTAGIAAGLVLGFLVLFAAVVGGTAYCWFRKRRQATRQSTLKRPLKAEPSIISGGGVVETPLYVDTEKFTYGRYGTLVTVTTDNGGTTWTAPTTVATASGQDARNSFNAPADRSSDKTNHRVLTPTRSFPVFNSRGSTSSSPVPLSPNSSLRGHHQCQTCAAVSAGLQSVPDATPRTTPKINGCLGVGGIDQTSRQISTYDNCRQMLDVRAAVTAPADDVGGRAAPGASDAMDSAFYFGDR